MGTFANSEDLGEMQHDVAFHLGLHCLLRPNQSSEKEIQYFLEIITRDPSIYTMNHPDLIACSFMENSIGLKRVGLKAHLLPNQNFNWAKIRWLGVQAECHLEVL